MYHLKLCRGLSYCNASGTIKATRQKPDIYIKDKATADAAVASGFFSLIWGADTPAFPLVVEEDAPLRPLGRLWATSTGSNLRA